MAKLLPVIHVADLAQALEQVKVAQDAGADGVWLIGHSMPWWELRQVLDQVRGAHRNFWLGVNFLDLQPHDAMAAADSADGVWVDNARTHEHGYAQQVLKVREDLGRTLRYFGGVAFKYQTQPEDLQQATALACQYMDVVTTSGDATGLAAPLQKITLMKEALGETPLAVASGITVENVEGYLPYVDYFLVATGISRSFHELDPELTAELGRRIRAA